MSSSMKKISERDETKRQKLQHASSTAVCVATDFPINKVSALDLLVLDFPCRA
jgi:hypothetical protein